MEEDVNDGGDEDSFLVNVRLIKGRGGLDEILLEQLKLLWSFGTFNWCLEITDGEDDMDDSDERDECS